MADHPLRQSSLTDSFGLEIERLIKQLPGADPTLRGTPESRPTVRPLGAPAASPASTATVRERHPTEWGVWIRTAAALGLAVAVIDWPYARTCGWMLGGYLTVVGTVLIVGSWASLTAWRTHSAVAHVLGLIVIYWGIVLAAEQVLPRIGYAAVEAGWRCVAGGA